MPSTIRDLTELTAVAVDDMLLVSDTSDVVNRDKRITRLNLVGTALSGGGSIQTGGNAVTIPVGGPVVMRSGTPTAGRVAGWLNNNQLEDGGFAVSDIARLTGTQTFDSGIVLQSAGHITVAAHKGIVANTDANLNDDSAVLISDMATQGVFLFHTTSVAGGNAVGFVSYRALSSPYVHIIPTNGASTILAAATGVLTGATGPDGKINISATTTPANGSIYIENRSGVAITFRILRLGA